MNKKIKQLFCMRKKTERLYEAASIGEAIRESDNINKLQLAAWREERQAAKAARSA